MEQVKKTSLSLLLFTLLITLMFCVKAVKSQVIPAWYLTELSHIEKEPHFKEVRGKASYYAGRFHGRRTANGEIYDMNGMTAAATKRYKFGDRLKVTNIKNGKSVIVKVNDRGAFGKKYGRLLDLSKGAFKKIANLKTGVINVKVQKL